MTGFGCGNWRCGVVWRGHSWTAAECSLLRGGGAEVQVLALLTDLSKVPKVERIGQLGGFWSSAIWPGETGALACHHVELEDMVQGTPQIQPRGNINDKASNKTWPLQKIPVTFASPWLPFRSLLLSLFMLPALDSMNSQKKSQKNLKMNGSWAEFPVPSLPSLTSRQTPNSYINMQQELLLRRAPPFSASLISTALFG